MPAPRTATFVARKWSTPAGRNFPALIAEGGRLVTESDRRAPLAIDLPTIFERAYGDTVIHIHGH